MIRNPPPVVKPKVPPGKADGGIEVISKAPEDKVDKMMMAKKRSRAAKSKNNSRSKIKEGEPGWSPYGCHYFPDPTEFPDPDPTSLPEEPLGKGEQYFLDLVIFKKQHFYV